MTLWEDFVNPQDHLRGPLGLKTPQRLVIDQLITEDPSGIFLGLVSWVWDTLVPGRHCCPWSYRRVPLRPLCVFLPRGELMLLRGRRRVPCPGLALGRRRCGLFSRQWVLSHLFLLSGHLSSAHWASPPLLRKKDTDEARVAGWVTGEADPEAEPSVQGAA